MHVARHFIPSTYQGCIVFQTPRDPSLIFWPMPSSIKNRGMPSNINIIIKGMRNAPEKKNDFQFNINMIFLAYVK